MKALLLNLSTFLLVTFFSITSVSAQPSTSFDKPVKLRLMGEILKFVDSPPEDIVTAKITVQDKQLLLRIGKVEELNRMEREQAVKWGVLFREIRFDGPAPLLEQIRNAEETGKILTVEGQLDTKTRQFLVASVTEAQEARSKH
jgi:hypothetical protein